MKRIASMYFCLVLLLAVAACSEQNAETDSPEQYSKDGIEFSHPGNWKVTDDSLQETVRYVMVETPGDAILTIHVFSTEEAPELPDFAQIFANATKDEIDIGTINSSTFSGVSNEDSYESMSEQFSVSLLGQDVPHSRIYKRRMFGNKVCFIMGQVSDEDKEKVMPGFNQIISSFNYTGG